MNKVDKAKVILEKSKENCEEAKYYAIKIEKGELYDEIYRMMRSVVFTHCFAKAFWGVNGEWERGLQELVVSDDIIEHLYAFITTDHGIIN